MRQARRSKEADRDLIEIWGYVAEVDSEAADSVLDYIDVEFGKLAHHPRMGKERRDLCEGLLCFPVFKPSWRSRYLVFYRESADGVEIARVLESHRDIAGMLGE